MAGKDFFIKAAQIETLITDPRGCLATDRIMVDGAPVGYMYREEPTTPEDSGWCFTAGDETSDYMAETDNIGIYALNTLANYDRDVLALVDAPVGAAYARPATGAPLRPLPANPARASGSVGESAAAISGLHPDHPVVEGLFRVTTDWALELPNEFNLRFENGTMVLWRPGVTAHLAAWENPQGDPIEGRVKQLLESVGAAATDLSEEEAEGFTRVLYRADDGKTASVATFAVAADSHLLAQLYYDDAETGTMATAIARSIHLFDGDSEAGSD